MAKAPLVSVIMPVYNARDYLRASLSCVTDQQYKKLQIITVDDGSTDESADIIREFQENDSRIMYIKTENGGPSKARNLGMDMAEGSYICFVDADDLCSDTFISSMISQIEPADICICKKVRWNQSQDRSTVDGWEEFYGTREELLSCLRAYKRSMRGATGRMYKTKIIRENNVRFREELRYGEDMYFNYEYFKFAELVYFLDEVLYTYRIHNPDSLSSKDHTFFLKQWKNERECIRNTFS